VAGINTFNRLKKTLAVLLTTITVSFFAPQAIAVLPVCSFASSDPDGDGFGWENKKSCRVSVQADPVEGIGICQSAASDPDGDGFGWESNKSCLVEFVSTNPSQQSDTKPICQRADSDPDGDGFGWENRTSCLVRVASEGNGPVAGQLLLEETVNLNTPACSDYKFDPDGDGYGWENSRSCTLRSVGDGGHGITDLVLVTGQSNALGAQTSWLDPLSFDEGLDSPVRRVYAHTNHGWSVAGLHQIWDRNWYPRGDIAGNPANNFAFHFAKHIVRKDPNAVVGIILITAPGESIQHWALDGDFFTEMQNKVKAAMRSLPTDVKVSGVLWHQGESDYYSNDYYENALQTLIGNFRAQPWFAPQGLFVCGETLSSPVNASLRKLNTDSDNLTGCASADGLTSVGDDVHLNAASLRSLGERYADIYWDLKP